MQLQVPGAEVCEAVRGVLPWAHSPDHVWLHEEHDVSQLLRQDGRMGAGSRWRPLHHRCRSWPGSNSNDAVAAAACSGSSHADPHFVEVAIWQVALLEVIQLVTLLEVIQLVTLLEMIQLIASQEVIQLVASHEMIQLVALHKVIQLTASQEVIQLVTSHEVIQLVASYEVIQLTASQEVIQPLVASHEVILLVA